MPILAHAPSSHSKSEAACHYRHQQHAIHKSQNLPTFSLVTIKEQSVPVCDYCAIRPDTQTLNISSVGSAIGRAQQAQLTTIGWEAG